MQRLREARVVVAELVLEPAPVVRRVALVGARRAARRGARAGAAPAVRAGPRRGARGRAPRTRPFAATPRRRAPPTSRSSRLRRRLDDGGDPGGGEDLAERPDRAADVVADVRLVEPAAVVAHEVAHPAVALGRVQERERAVEGRRPGLLVAAACERERDDGQPGDVVDAVAAVAVRDDPVRVLHDADVVDEREQMVGAQARELEVGDAGGSAPRRERVRLAQHGRRRLGDRRPRERRADPPRLRARRGERFRLVDVVADRVGERGGSSNGTSRPAPEASMSCAYQYGVETTAQPAAIANVSAPEAICSRFRYGVTKTSVAASRSESSSIERKRSSNSTCSPRSSSSTRRSSMRRYRSPSRCATSGCVRPAIT